MSETNPVSSQSKQADRDRLRAERRAVRGADRSLWMQQWRCFWTRPFGHNWESESWAVKRCTRCPKSKVVGNL